MVGDTLYEWIVDNFDFVSTHHPTWHDMAKLILPTRAFFDAPAGANHETALHIMHNIKDLIGLEGQVDLHPLAVLPDELRHQYGQLADTAGQFMTDGSAMIITYDPTLLRRPLVLINTLAHELMHARLAGVVSDLPGGDEMHELATDLHCIIAGFGVFQLEAHEQAGWSGYMSQASRAVALATFLRFHGLEVDAALPYLSKRPARWLRKAWQETATNAP
ncbi:MAG: hypothetical protein ACSHWS_13420 [Sulfitobacter sp.]